MARYAINLKDGRVIAATDETFRHPDYEEILPVDAQNIESGKITKEAAMVQLLIKRNKGGNRRSIEELNKFHTSNVRTKTANDPDEGGDDGELKPLSVGDNPVEAASAVSQTPAPSASESEPSSYTDAELCRMTPKRLREVAEERGVSLPDFAGKSDILGLLGVSVA